MVALVVALGVARWVAPQRRPAEHLRRGRSLPSRRGGDGLAARRHGRRDDRHRAHVAVGPGLPAGRLRAGERARHRAASSASQPAAARPSRWAPWTASLPSGEGGLLGLAVPPGPDPSFVLAYTTTATDNRVVRIEWDGERLGQQVPILTGIPKNTYHDGGRLLALRTAPSSSARATRACPTSAQDPASLAGKVLRITADGAPAPGNPDPGSPVVTLGPPQRAGPRPRQRRPALGQRVRRRTTPTS